MTGHRWTSILKGLLLSLVLSCVSENGLAMQIPIGLDWREKVLIQEYWLQGKPRYCVTNLRKKTVDVKVSRWVSFTDPVEPLTQWSLGAEKIQCFDAQQFLDEMHLHFSLAGGERLGLLRGPRQSKSNRAHNDKALVASFQGLNGACRDLGIWLEQDTLWFRAGKKAALTLVTPAGKGVIMSDSKPEAEPPNKIVLEDVFSASLPVEMGSDRITIDTNNSSKQEPVHRVRLNFTAPAVKRPTLFQISAKVRISEKNWGCFVRGVLVQ